MFDYQRSPCIKLGLILLPSASKAPSNLGDHMGNVSMHYVLKLFPMAIRLNLKIYHPFDQFAEE